MSLTGIVFLSLFGATSIVQLVFCYREMEKARKISKSFCLFFLILAIVFLKPDAYLLWISLIFSMIGDIFLIFKKRLKCLYIGASSFLVGHILMCGQILLSIGGVDWAWFVCYFAAFATLLVLNPIVFERIIRPIAHNLSFLGCSYITALGVLLVTSIMLAILSPYHLYGLMVTFGAMFFIVSDSTLLYTSFVKDVKRRDFYIMLTYLLAEFLISFGLVMIALQS